jgi:hypothetical protein
MGLSSTTPSEYFVHARLATKDDGKLMVFSARAGRSKSDIIRALVRGLYVEQAEAYRPLAISTHAERGRSTQQSNLHRRAREVDA